MPASQDPAEEEKKAPESDEDQPGSAGGGAVSYPLEVVYCASK